MFCILFIFPRECSLIRKAKVLLTLRRLLAATTVICCKFTSIIILRAAFPVGWTWVVLVGTSSNRPIAYILRRMRWLCRGFRCRFCSCFHKNKWNDNNQIKKIRHVSFQLQWNILWLVSITYLVEESCGSSSSDLFYVYILCRCQGRVWCLMGTDLYSTSKTQSASHTRMV